MKKLAVLLLIVFALAPLQAKINITDLPDTLQVDLDTKYAVHWAVTFTPVVSQCSATMELFEPMFNAVRLINESDNFQLSNSSLLYEHSNCTTEQFIKVAEYLYRTSLPEPYGWFFGLLNDDTIVFGIRTPPTRFKPMLPRHPYILNPSMIISLLSVFGLTMESLQKLQRHSKTSPSGIY